MKPVAPVTKYAMGFLLAVAVAPVVPRARVAWPVAQRGSARSRTGRCADYTGAAARAAGAAAAVRGARRFSMIRSSPQPRMARWMPPAMRVATDTIREGRRC